MYQCDARCHGEGGRRDYGRRASPYFSQHVLFRHELTSSLQELHILISEEKQALRKEELFLHLLEELIRRYSDVTFLNSIPEPSDEVKMVCGFLEKHYAENVTLNDLSELTGWSKYHLLRSFTKQKELRLIATWRQSGLIKRKNSLNKG